MLSGSLVNYMIPLAHSIVVQAQSRRLILFVLRALLASSTIHQSALQSRSGSSSWPELLPCCLTKALAQGVSYLFVQLAGFLFNSFFGMMVGI